MRDRETRDDAKMSGACLHQQAMDVLLSAERVMFTAIDSVFS
jgi:hypothetical protein